MRQIQQILTQLDLTDVHHVRQILGDVDEDCNEEYDLGWMDDEFLDLQDGEQPPELDEEELERRDEAADQEELERLLSMGAYVDIDVETAKTIETLSTKFVRDWRQRPAGHPNEGCWFRRSRLVSREFKFMGPRRQDVYSAALPTQVSKVLILWGLQNNYKFWTLDVSDAFLCVPQPTPVAVNLGGGRWVKLLRLLPGQRCAAAEWSNFIGERIEQNGLQYCIVCPTVFRTERFCCAIHVDDILLVGCEKKAGSLIGHLTENCGLKLKVSGPHTAGSSFKFLKRCFALKHDMAMVGPNPKYLKKLQDMLKDFNLRARKTPLPSGYFPIPIAEDAEKDKCSSEQHGLYQRVTGLLLYVMVDRPDLMFGLKQLSSKMSGPNRRTLRPCCI